VYRCHGLGSQASGAPDVFPKQDGSTPWRPPSYRRLYRRSEPPPVTNVDHGTGGGAIFSMPDSCVQNVTLQPFVNRDSSSIPGSL
jgi:hypothetical protein